MVDFFELYNLSETQRAQARRIQESLPRDLVARARNRAERKSCFIANMMAKYPDIYEQWHRENSQRGAFSDGFVDRLPAAEAAEGNRLIRELANDRERLMQLAEQSAARLGLGNVRIGSESLSHIAVSDITDSPEGCSVGSREQPRRHAALPRLPSIGV